jgi:hypothetical protein
MWENWDIRRIVEELLLIFCFPNHECGLTTSMNMEVTPLKWSHQENGPKNTAFTKKQLPSRSINNLL